MPEIWIPFGSVEALVTVQAENLGAVEAPDPEKSTGESERLSEVVRGASKLFVCDSSPTTVELLKDLSSTIAASSTMKIYSAAPKKLEGAIPDLRGRVSTLPPPLRAEAQDKPVFAAELMEPGTKLFVGTAKPDPMFGIIDARAQACLNWSAGSAEAAAKSMKSMEPVPFQKTDAFDTVDSLMEQVAESTFLTVVPRGGRVRSAMENAPFDAVKNGFFEMQMSPSRALIVGSGGSGHDDTFSSALRGLWTSVQALRRSGTILIVAECAEGLGSTAMEMFATGRLAGDGGKRKDFYVPGIEEVFYLNKLKEEYEVLLLSGLPETYAKNKFGLTTAKGSGEAVGRLLNRVGRTGKVNVVTRASECRIVPA